MSFKIYCSLPYFWYRNQTISRVGKSIRTEHFRLRKRGRSMCNTFLFKVKNKVRTLKKNKYSFGSGEYFSISVSLIRILTLNELKLKIILNTQIDYFASYCFISFIKCFPVSNNCPTCPLSTFFWKWIFALDNVNQYFTC